MRRWIDPAVLFGRPEREAPPPLVPGPLTPAEGVIDVSASRLAVGTLLQHFRQGAAAVRVIDEPAMPQLWFELMPATAEDGWTVHGERLPWASTLRSIARNHRPGHCVGGHVGDVVFSAPQVLTYIARKLVLTPAADGGLQIEPPVFHQAEREFRLPAETAQAAWELATRLLRSLTPEGFVLTDPSVSIERLQYDASERELAQRIQLLRDAGGRFSQLGHRIDELWAKAAGPFRQRWIRPVFAFAGLVPRLGVALAKLNERIRSSRTEDRLPEGSEILGEAHTDGRLFTCLASSRDALRTEFWDGHVWRELPLTPHSLVIFPGTDAQRLLGVPATRHRVLRMPGAPSEGALNATLVFGLSTRA